MADRLVVRADQRRRLVDSLEQAFRFGKGRLALVVPDGGARIPFSELLECARAMLTNWRDDMLAGAEHPDPLETALAERQLAARK